MRAGRLRHRLELQARSEFPDGQHGQVPGDWATELVVWAWVRPMGVVERSEAAKSIGQATHLVTIRGRACKPTPAKRFKWGLRILEIVGPMDYDERGIEVRVLCRERA